MKVKKMSWNSQISKTLQRLLLKFPLKSQFLFLSNENVDFLWKKYKKLKQIVIKFVLWDQDFYFPTTKIFLLYIYFIVTFIWQKLHKVANFLQLKFFFPKITSFIKISLQLFKL